jgi:hypothetical protein
MLGTQQDGWIRSGFSQFGFYYLFSVPFMIIGLVSVVHGCAVKIRRREHAPEFYALVQVFAAVLVALLLREINANRVNAIHIPLILLCAVGVREVLGLNWKLAGQSGHRAVLRVVPRLYGVLFREGQTLLSDFYRPGTKEAIAYAQKLTDDTIVCRMHGRYSKVLYYTKLPLEQYFDTVVYKEPPHLDPVSFDQFVFESPHATTTGDAVYIVEDDELATYTAAGYTIEPFDRMAVAYLRSRLRPGNTTKDEDGGAGEPGVFVRSPGGPIDFAGAIYKKNARFGPPCSYSFLPQGRLCGSTRWDRFRAASTVMRRCPPIRPIRCLPAGST